MSFQEKFGWVGGLSSIQIFFNFAKPLSALCKFKSRQHICSFAVHLYTMSVHLLYILFDSCEEFVSVRDVTSAHLISFQPEKDLLPMVLSCCQYSLQMGKGYAITYDFVTLQRQIQERFIRNRPRLDPQVTASVMVNVVTTLMVI